MKKLIIKKMLEHCPYWMAGCIRKCIKIKPNQMSRFHFKIAQDIPELEGAYRLVHDEYVRCGYMDASGTGMRFGVHNFLPETTTFVGTCEGQTALTITLFQDTEIGLPMDAIYKEEIDALRASGRKVAEVGALATHPSFRNGNQNIPMYGNKIMYLYARENLQIDDLVIAINPRHEWIYKHILLFERIGPLKTYGHVKGAAALGYRLDLKKAEENYQKIYAKLPQESNLYAFFVLQQSSNIELPPKGVNCLWHRDVMHHFLTTNPAFLDVLDSRTLEVFARYYSLLAGESEKIGPETNEISGALEDTLGLSSHGLRYT